MRKKVVAGNWKMTCTVSEAVSLTSDLINKVSSTDDVDIIICPPFIDIPGVSFLTKDTGIKVGAQNMYCEEKGAYTGEVSYLMLKPLCSYVILGHSERRQIFGETDELVNKKVIKAIENSLTPIVCIGETLEQNEAGETENVLAKQIKESLKNINKDDDIIVAYEPIWAIGTGKAATSDQAEDTIRFIRSVISKRFGATFAKKTRLLYGGSVKPSNALELMSKENIDGVLVGGASLKADDFNSIILAASEASN